MAGTGISVTALTAQVNKSNTTLVDVTDLNQTLAASERVYLRYVCVVRTATATTGARFTVTSDLAPVRFAFTASGIVAADGTGASYFGAITSSGDQVIFTGLPVLNTDYICVIEGVVLNSAGTATIKLQFANETGTVQVSLMTGTHVQRTTI